MIRSKGKRMFKVIDDINTTAYKLAEVFQKRYNSNLTSPVGEKYWADQVLEYLKIVVKSLKPALFKKSIFAFSVNGSRYPLIDFDLFNISFSENPTSDLYSLYN